MRVRAVFGALKPRDIKSASKYKMPFLGFSHAKITKLIHECNKELQYLQFDAGMIFLQVLVQFLGPENKPKLIPRNTKCNFL